MYSCCSQLLFKSIDSHERSNVKKAHVGITILGLNLKLLVIASDQKLWVQSRISDIAVL